MKIKVILIYGGPSGEYDVSLKSGQKIAQNLDRDKYTVQELLIGKDLSWQFLPEQEKLSQDLALEKIKEMKFDVAFIAIHGEFGEDGALQKLLNSIHLPYTGSDASASELAMNKAESNKKYTESELLVPKSIVLKNKEEVNAMLQGVNFPLIIKPLHGGSSVGVAIVNDKNMLDKAIDEGFRHDSQLLVQEYIKGREFTCGVLEKNGQLVTLPPTEIISKTNFFNYEAKYTPGASEEVTPPDLPDDKINQLQETALKAHQALGCRGMSRSDFILSGDTWYILETNTIPGMTETSLLPQEAKAAGIEYPQLLDTLIDSALRNHGK